MKRVMSTRHFTICALTSDSAAGIYTTFKFAIANYVSIAVSTKTAHVQLMVVQWLSNLDIVILTSKCRVLKFISLETTESFYFPVILSA